MAAFPEPTTTALAGHARRLGAALLDGIAYVFFVGAFGVAGLLLGLLGGSGSDTADDGWEQLGWVIFGVIAGVAIGVLCWLVLVVWLVQRPGVRNGQTIGKQIVGIRAVRADGARLGAGSAVLRELLAKGVLIFIAASLVSGVLGFFDGGSLGILVAIAVWYGPAFADDERRALHDRMVDTRVVDAKLAGVVAAPTDDLWPATP